MPSSVPRVEFGHPHYWKVVAAEFPLFFEVHPRLTASFNSIATKPRPSADRDMKIVVNLCLMAGVAAEELITLVGNGLGMGAIKIARNLLELSINAEYLRANPNEVEDFAEWYWVEENKTLTYAEQHDPVLLARLTPEWIANTKSEFGRIRSRFENPGSKKIRPSWCRENLANRAVKTHFELAYRLINPIGSQFLHGTSGAVLNHFDLTISTEQIAAPPSLRWCRQALCGGHNCLAMVIHTLETMFNEEATPSSDEIAKDFQYAWEV